MTTELSVRRSVALRLAAVVLFAFGVLLGSRLIGKQKPAIIVPTRASINGSSKIRIGWAGPALGPERPPSGLTMAEAKKFATDNSGNMIWALGAQLLLDGNATELIGLLEPPHTAAVHAVLLPTANVLVNTSITVFIGYTAFMTKVMRLQTAPIMMVGIGSHVKFSDLRPLGSGSTIFSESELYKAAASQIKLTQEQVSFVELVQHSEGFVSARGRFTAEVMTTHGLAHPLVLGCPSLLINHTPRLGAVLQRKWDAVLQQRSRKLRLAVALPAISPTAMKPVLKLLAERIFKVFPFSVVVVQTELDLKAVEALRSEHGLCFKEGRVLYFYDPQSWIASLQSNFDFLFGFRIHGTMAGVAAEVPGIVIPTDLRISELAEAMAIPSVALHKANLNPVTFDFFDFMKSVPSYGTKLDARRREVAKLYMGEFTRLGVPLHPGVAALAGQQDPG